MAEINLLDRYPRSKRDLTQRSLATETDRQVSKRFGREYFDGHRNQGYGGYSYHPRFWQDTVTRLRDYYQLTDKCSVLDVGCAKGFMLHDFREIMPEAQLCGLDISSYAIQNCIDDVSDSLILGNVCKLPFQDNSFDLVVAINVIHNLPEMQCREAVSEIQRVSGRYAFIVVDGYRSQEEKQAIESWVLTAETVLSTDDWSGLFAQCGYTGDYYWFTTN